MDTQGPDLETLSTISKNVEIAIKRVPELAAIVQSVEMAAYPIRPEIYLRTAKLSRRHKDMLRRLWRDLPIRRRLKLSENLDIWRQASQIRKHPGESTRDFTTRWVQHSVIHVTPPVHERLLTQIRTYFAITLALLGLIPLSAVAPRNI